MRISYKDESGRHKTIIFGYKRDDYFIEYLSRESLTNLKTISTYTI